MQFPEAEKDSVSVYVYPLRKQFKVSIFAFYSLFYN